MEISATEIACLLEPFELQLDHHQLEAVRRYVALLVRWNHAINLTAIRRPEEIVVRHFGESMYLTKFATLTGTLLDVGSGAGFPGLPIKLMRPELRVVLLEPSAKKRAFLKEVVRECNIDRVEVSGTRVEDFCGGHQREFESVTMRAVGDSELVLPAVAGCVAASGGVYLWLTKATARTLVETVPDFQRLFAWTDPLRLPLSRDREIWRGRLAP